MPNTKKSATIQPTKIKDQLGKEKVGDKLGKDKPQRLTRTSTAMKAGMRPTRIRNTRSA